MVLERCANVYVMPDMCLEVKLECTKPVKYLLIKHFRLLKDPKKRRIPHSVIEANSNRIKHTMKKLQVVFSRILSSPNIIKRKGQA